MKTKGHSKRKTIIRSSFIFVLVLSILLSSISISFAFEIPLTDTPIPFDEVVELQTARDWVADILEQDPDGYIMVYKDIRDPMYNSNIWIWYISADTSIYVNQTTGKLYASSRYGMTGIYQYWLGSGQTGINNMTNQYHQ